LLFKIDPKQNQKSRRRFENGFWNFNRLPNYVVTRAIPLNHPVRGVSPNGSL
jgi:hypothetical protein